MGTDVAIDKLRLKQCFICNQWTEPRHLIAVMLNELDTLVCRICYRDLVQRQGDLDLEALKEDEDEQAKKSFGISQPEED